MKNVYEGTYWSPVDGIPCNEPVLCKIPVIGPRTIGDQREGDILVLTVVGTYYNVREIDGVAHISKWPSVSTVEDVGDMLKTVIEHTTLDGNNFGPVEGVTQEEAEAWQSKST